MALMMLRGPGETGRDLSRGAHGLQAVPWVLVEPRFALRKAFPHGSTGLQRGPQAHLTPTLSPQRAESPHSAVDSRALAAIFRGFRRAPFSAACPHYYCVRTMFAVLKTGGKQYKVAKDDVIHVERLPGEAGAQILFDQVLLVGEGANATAGSPLVSGATVAGTLMEQVLADKVIIFKKRRRHNYRRKRGHRQPLSVIRIDEILTDGAAPSPRKAVEPNVKPAKVKAADDDGDEAPAKKAKKPAKKIAQPKAPRAKKSSKPAAAKGGAKAKPKSKK
jgi:large subunit ribosomal protein L21